MSVHIDVVRSGVRLAEHDRAAVEAMFAASYHRYHYTDELRQSDRTRFLARDASKQIVGFCAATELGRFAQLSNLVVDGRMRGLGIGRALERTRRDYVSDAGLGVYVSCSCDDGASQRLKLELGLQPICVRYGYRVDVTGPGSIGTSVVFADRLGGLEAEGSETLLDAKRQRARVVFDGSSDLAQELRELPDNWYVDIVSAFHVLEPSYNGTTVVPVGVDLDLFTGRYRHCHQLANERYRRAVESNPVIVREPVLPESVGVQ